jgi:hypothetical protein
MSSQQCFGTASSIAITLDIYSHVLPDMQQQAAAAMERVPRD